MLIDKKIMNPTSEAVSSIKRINMVIPKEVSWTFSNKFSKTSIPFIVNGFFKLFEKEKDLELSKLYNLCIKLLCWMIRYNTLFDFDGDNLPILIYYLKTNKRGIATFKLSKNLKAGKYTIKTTCNGLTNSNKITVKK